MSQSTGRKIYNTSIKTRKNSNKLADAYLNDLRKLNKQVNQKVSKQYREFLTEILDSNNDGLIDRKMSNLSKVNRLLRNLENKVFNPYKSKYAIISKQLRKEQFRLRREKTREINKILKDDEGISQKQAKIFTETFNTILKRIQQREFENINFLIKKWRNFSYDIFFRGITDGMNIEKVMNLLYTQDGTLRIGSSFEQSSEQEMIIAAVTERTNYVLEEAKKNNYTYCWNSNPMDKRTKPICADATLAGVIPKEEMGQTYGFPPRYICRCDLTFTRPEWTDINKGINKAIDDRRKELLKLLIESPASFQKSLWIIRKGPGRGTKVIPKDIQRAQGDLYYKDVSDMIDKLTLTQVPDFDEDDLKDFS